MRTCARLVLLPPLAILALLGSSGTNPPPGAAEQGTATATGSLEIDFDQVDWGYVWHCATDIVSGDQLWKPPSDGSPTVRNTGAAPAYLCVEFSDMVGQNLGGVISEFGARFLSEMIDPMHSGATYCFSNPLPPYETASLDLAVHPPGGVEPDVYAGQVNVAGWVVSTRAEGMATTGTVVEWKWELPDMEPGTPGMQYTSPGDDDPLLFPGNPPADHHMMQVSLSGSRTVEYWAAVEDPDGMSFAAYVDVYGPDGSLLVSCVPTAFVVCDQVHLGAWNTPGTVLGAAYETGQMSAAETENILYACSQFTKKVLRATSSLSDEHCGEYRVDVTAERGVTVTNWFDVLCAGSAVGGAAELPDVPGSPAPPYAAIAGGAAAAAALVLAAGAWYARRRFSQR